MNQHLTSVHRLVMNGLDSRVNNDNYRYIGRYILLCAGRNLGGVTLALSIP